MYEFIELKDLKKQVIGTPNYFNHIFNLHHKNLASNFEWKQILKLTAFCLPCIIINIFQKLVRFHLFDPIRCKKKKKKENSLNKKWKYIHYMYIYSLHNNQLIEPSTLQSILILYTSELSIQWAIKRWNFSLVLHLWFSFSVLISLNGLKFLTRDSFLWILKTFGFQSPRRKKTGKKEKKARQN